MLIDLLLLLFLLSQVWFGWRSGLLRQVTAIASLCLGLFLGAMLAPLLGRYLLDTITRDPFRARMTAFLFVAGVVGLGFRLLATWVEIRSEAGLPKEERSRRRGNDRVLGGIFGSVKGCVVALILAAAAVGFWPQSSLFKSSQLMPAFALGGARILPEGAVEVMRVWMATSTQEVQRSLQIRLSEPPSALGSTQKAPD